MVLQRFPGEQSRGITKFAHDGFMLTFLQSQLIFSWTAMANFFLGAALLRFQKCQRTFPCFHSDVHLNLALRLLSQPQSAFFFLMKSSTSDPAHDPFGGQGSAVLEVLSNVYIALVVVVLVCSLGNRPQVCCVSCQSGEVCFRLKIVTSSCRVHDLRIPRS